MAYVLKSNSELTSNANSLFVTTLGLAPALLKDYLDRLTAWGYTMTQIQFNALKKLHMKINDLGVLNNVIEIYPFFGSTVNQKLCKYKGKNSNQIATFQTITDGGPYNSDAHGFNWSTYSAGAAVGFGTGLTDYDFQTGYGIVSYQDMTQGATIKTIFGKGTTLTATNASVIYGTSGDDLGFSNRGNAKTQLIDVYGKNLLSAEVRISGNTLVERKGYLNKSLIHRDEPALDVSVKDSITYLMGARNVNNGGTNNENSFHGKIRFFMVTDGNINPDKYNDFLSAVELFISESGKTF